jgi:hypothetical protein
MEVVGRFGADEDTHRLFRQLLGVITRIFQTFPALLQDQALVRAHGPGFPGRDIEEQGVKAVSIL